MADIFQDKDLQICLKSRVVSLSLYLQDGKEWYRAGIIGVRALLDLLFRN